MWEISTPWRREGGREGGRKRREGEDGREEGREGGMGKVGMEEEEAVIVIRISRKRVKIMSGVGVHIRIAT